MYIQRAKETRFNNRLTSGSIIQKKTNKLKNSIGIDNEQELSKKNKKQEFKNLRGDNIFGRPTQRYIKNSTISQTPQEITKKYISQKRRHKALQLLTAAEILKITPNNMALVKKHFGENAQKVLNIAPDMKTLQQWTMTIVKLDKAVEKAQEKVSNPALTGVTPEEKKALVSAISARNDKLKSILSSTSNSSAPAWKVNCNIGATSSASPSSAPAAQGLQTLSNITPLTRSYTSHGNFNATITEAKLKSYVSANHSHFTHRGKVSGGEGYQLYLGDKGLEQWYITVTLKPDNSAIITHFGPFGATTAASIEKASSK